jgi:2-polyprenyl-6-hydroxyphenyl methylase/3-demethylubiquinone-9 3-methyltransferase
VDEERLYEIQHGEGKCVPHYTFPFLRKVFRRFDVHREDLVFDLLDGGDRFLDVGCGSGSLVFRAKEKYQEAYGVDISEFCIREAEERKRKQSGEGAPIHFSRGNVGERIDFPDGMFDTVASVAVIEHVFDLYGVVGEIRRVLKKEGVFVIEVPNIAYLRYRIELLFGKLPVTSTPHNWRDVGWDGGHLHYFTRKTLCGLLDETGFEVLKVTGAGLFGSIRSVYPSLLTGDLCVKARKR